MAAWMGVGGPLAFSMVNVGNNGAMTAAIAKAGNVAGLTLRGALDCLQAAPNPASLFAARTNVSVAVVVMCKIAAFDVAQEALQAIADRPQNTGSGRTKRFGRHGHLWQPHSPAGFQQCEHRPHHESDDDRPEHRHRQLRHELAQGQRRRDVHGWDNSAE